jgi:hypothetical protein
LKLIETEEFMRAARLNRFGGNSAARVLMTVLRINKINKLRGMDFIDALIEKLQLEFEVSEEELKNIPREGAFITVSNHPFGGIDGMLLVKILEHHRCDIKVMSNFILNKIEPVSDYMLPVNPFERRKEAPVWPVSRRRLSSSTREVFLGSFRPGRYPVTTRTTTVSATASGSTRP